MRRMMNLMHHAMNTEKVEKVERMRCPAMAKPTG